MPETTYTDLTVLDPVVRRACWDQDGEVSSVPSLGHATRMVREAATAQGINLTNDEAEELIVTEVRTHRLRPRPLVPTEQAATWFREQITESRQFIAGLSGPAAPKIALRAQGRINGLTQAWIEMARLGLINPLTDDDRAFLEV